MYQCYFEKSLLAEVVTAVGTGTEQTRAREEVCATAGNGEVLHSKQKFFLRLHPSCRLY